MNRRLFLRSAASILALPALPSLVPRAARAAETPPPLRMVFWFVPNGIVMDNWTPTGVGTAYDLPTILQSLTPVQSDVSVLSGLENKAARVSRPGDHARGTGSFLTCETVQHEDTYNGISVDQVYANALAGATPFPSLEFGMEGGSSAGTCDSGYACAYQRNISWASATTPMSKVTSPRTAFNRLFADYDPSLTSEEVDRRRLLRLSVLDFVTQDISALEPKLGQTDRRKLDEYLTAVRQLELRIDFLKEQACVPGEAADSSGDFELGVDLMNEITVMALQCDLSRVVTFMLGNGGSGRQHDFLGVSGAHHEMSHHGGEAETLEKLTTIDTWEVGRFADFVGRLAETTEADGSRLLDNTLAYFSSEIADGNTHAHHNLPVLLAGSGRGTHSPGRHIQFADRTPMANLFLSMLQAGGVEATTFGQDGTQTLPELLG